MSYLQSKSSSPQHQTHNFPSFPHRTLRKEVPRIGNKSIPIHKLDINRLYNCQMSTSMFDRWAFVPTQTHKSNCKAISPDSTQKRKFFYFQSQKQFQSTSTLFLKRYLKRKDKKTKTQAMCYDHIFHQKQSFSVKRKSLVYEKGSKSLSQMTTNFKKIHTQMQQGQFWPQIIVKGITQSCKDQKKKRRKVYTQDVQYENKYYDIYLQKYVESNCQKEAEKQAAKQIQENQQLLKKRKPIQFKIMKKRHKCIQQTQPPEQNYDT